MVALTELIESFHHVFAEDQVNVDEVIMLMKSYNSNPAEWRQYAVFDEHKHTRNLVDIGNGKYNLMVLCWGPGMRSSIHDHSNAHCFVKILDGVLLETRHAWPDNENKQTPLKKLNQGRYEENSACYMSDKLGLHRMENPSHSDGAVSLHLYIPPFDACNAFDERTGNKMKCQMTFFTKYGVKVDCSGRKSWKSCRFGENVVNR
ncbi:unnamed protein product [Angiostrongylus costaricensis]|uniref:Cysteine dioxygenase n=1 Tax=Angiostrongylus costaricensis TaxID=334426 RepID=A0A0R3PU68_ANGCS|nr:unnamed protein product [Angiostrongylus costaricensis]